MSTGDAPTQPKATLEQLEIYVTNLGQAVSMLSRAMMDLNQRLEVLEQKQQGGGIIIP